MSDTAANLSRKIDGARDLRSVVRTMKAVAASNIAQYEKSVRSLAEYYRAVELGLCVCFRKGRPTIVKQSSKKRTKIGVIGAVVFGSDQGLVGQFNEILSNFAANALRAWPGQPQVWAVGERMHSCLADAGVPLKGLFAVPNSVQAITPLVGEILLASETYRGQDHNAELHLFYNHPASTAVYAAASQRLLPLDEIWLGKLAEIHWPTRNLPELVGGNATLSALIGEYLFVSLFRACAESLASENASRLAAMQRADKNIDQLLDDLSRSFHSLRQSSIDEELFDVISGFEAMTRPRM